MGTWLFSLLSAYRVRAGQVAQVSDTQTHLRQGGEADGGRGGSHDPREAGFGHTGMPLLLDHWGFHKKVGNLDILLTLPVFKYFQ